MSGKPKIYWVSGSIPCWKPMIVMEEMGITYDAKMINFSKQEHKTEEMKKLNPRGQMPVFIAADGSVINESTAICLYLEQNYKPTKDSNPLVPKENDKCANVLQRTFEISENLHTKLMVGIVYKLRDTNVEKRDKNFNTEMENNKKALLTELGVWEQYLQETKYAATDDFTMADVFFFPYIAWTKRLGLNLEKFHRIKEYHDFVQDRPSVKKTEPPHWKEGPPEFQPLKDL